MSATSSSNLEFKRACYIDYVCMATSRGVAWLLTEAEECEEAARWYENPPSFCDEPDPGAARRAAVRAQMARAVADLGIQAIRREAASYNKRKGPR